MTAAENTEKTPMDGAPEIDFDRQFLGEHLARADDLAVDFALCLLGKGRPADDECQK